MKVLEIVAIILMFVFGFLFAAKTVCDPETTTEHLGKKSINMFYIYFIFFFIALLLSIIR